MRFLLDIDVVVSAMRSPTGGSAELVRQIRLGKATMVVSAALALEYEAICMLDEHRLSAGLNGAEVESYIRRLIDLAEEVQPHFRWRPQLRDPGDELVLEAVVNGRATAIVTFNLRDLWGAKSAFGIDVIRPGEALRRIRE